MAWLKMFKVKTRNKNAQSSAEPIQSKEDRAQENRCKPSENSAKLRISDDRKKEVKLETSRQHDLSDRSSRKVRSSCLKRKYGTFLSVYMHLWFSIFEVPYSLEYDASLR